MEYDSGQMLDILSQVVKPPFEIVQRAVGNEWTFALQHFPAKIDSDEDPPERIGDGAEVIPIDGVMGLYDPDEQRITIFRKGIKRASAILNVREVDLTLIVRCHEWSHALLHVGLKEAERLRVTKNVEEWDECLARATRWFRGLNDTLHERLAQLLTLYGLRSLREDASAEARAVVERIEAVFESLMRCQSPGYRIDAYQGVPKSRVIASIDLLKSGGINGLEAWQTVITW